MHLSQQRYLHENNNMRRFLVIVSTAFVTSCISALPTDRPLPADTNDAIMVISTRINDQCVESAKTVGLRVLGTS